MNCPCCSNQPFANCCQPFLDNTQHPQTPEQLMSSRYSAFVTKNADYLLATYWKEDPKKVTTEALNQERIALHKSMSTTEWLGLKIIKSSIDKHNPHNGMVEFIAFYHDADTQESKLPLEQLHEKSEFIQSDGKWYYSVGEILDDVKMSRNDTCFCGSNKKFKRCHGQ